MNRLEFFDEKAESWDELLTPAKLRCIKQIMSRAGIKRGERVLDVGCGTGVLLPLLQQAVEEEGEVVALDFSTRMLNEAERKFGSEFKYVHAHAESMPANDAYFDVVMCFAVFPHFENKEDALREIYRVLKPGGRLIIAHADSREKINSFHGKVDTAVENDHIPPKRETMLLLKNAGFARVQIDNRSNHYFASGRKLE